MVVRTDIVASFRVSVFARLSGKPQSKAVRFRTVARKSLGRFECIDVKDGGITA
jgi:hypothetical protein